MKKTMLLVAVAFTIAGVLMATGCTRVRLSDTQRGSGETSVDERTFELDGADKLIASARMGVGELQLAASTSSSDTLSARFEYAPTSWKPQVEFDSDGAEATFSADQSEASEMQLGDKVRNLWDLKLPSGVPTELSLKLGVGESNVDLRDIDIRDLLVTTGVGSTEIDLSGARAEDIDARIECGVGETVIRVPSDMGVRIIGGKDGLGDLSTEGFRAEGDALVNEAFDSAGPRMEIRLTRGVGEVSVEQAR